MYAIIYWKDDNSVYPYLTDDGQLRLFDRLSDADEVADRIEKGLVNVKYPSNDIECRVLCIEGVKE